MFAAPDGGQQRLTDREDDSGGESDDDGPLVLLGDDPRRAEQYQRWLEPLFTTLVGETPSDVVSRMVSELDVAVLGAAISEDTKQRLVELLDRRCPFVRVIVVPHDDQPPMLEAPGYDACVFEPVERDQLVEAVKRMARLATYERTVTTYFQYTTQAAAIQFGQADSDVPAETRAELQAEIDRIGARLERMRSSLDDADREALMESMGEEASATFGGEVHKVTAKRTPDECAECGLNWTVDHGGDLGFGCEQLGSFVWKCKNCGAVQQASDPSHQWVS